MRQRRHQQQQRVIPPLSALPEPSRQRAEDDGALSRIWTRGRFTLRIRTRSRENRGVLTEFIDGEPIRNVDGSLDFLATMASRWFASVKWDGEE
jgi:hypothetical protein